MPAVPAALAIKQTPMGNFCLSEEKRAVLHKLGWARTGMSQTDMKIREKKLWEEQSEQKLESLYAGGAVLQGITWSRGWC